MVRGVRRSSRARSSSAAASVPGSAASRALPIEVQCRGMAMPTREAIR